MLFIVAVLFAIPTYGLSLVLYIGWKLFRRSTIRHVDIEKVILFVSENYDGSVVGTCIQELSHRSAKTQLLKQSFHHTQLSDILDYFEVRINGKIFRTHLSKEPSGSGAILRVQLAELPTENYAKAVEQVKLAESWQEKLCQWFSENANVVADLTPTNITSQSALYSTIYANSENLSMHLPEEIGRLTHLETLSFTDHAIATLPKTIGNLCNLKELLFLRNRIKHIPDEICQLKYLSEVNLMNNELVELPDDIGNLENLRELWLYDNRLTRLPASIVGLINLKYISLMGNAELRLTQGQADWLISLMRKGAEISLDASLEIKMAAAYPDFLMLQARRREESEAEFDKI